MTVLNKFHSYLGRIFVWKVSLSHFTDHLLFGVGPGNFAYYYPKWQIEYVRDNENLQWKYLLKDSVEGELYHYRINKIYGGLNSSFDLHSPLTKRGVDVHVIIYWQ